MRVRLPRWQANQLPAHRHLLAAAQLEARGTEVFAPAGATFEMIRRTFVKIAVRVAPMIECCGTPRRACRCKPALSTTKRVPIVAEGLCSVRRARPTTMAGRRGGGLGRTGGCRGCRGGVYRGTHRSSSALQVVSERRLSLDRLQKLYSRHYIMPPMPPWLWSG